MRHPHANREEYAAFCHSFNRAARKVETRNARIREEELEARFLSHLLDLFAAPMLQDTHHVSN